MGICVVEVVQALQLTLPNKVTSIGSDAAIGKLVIAFEVVEDVEAVEVVKVVVWQSTQVFLLTKITSIGNFVLAGEDVTVRKENRYYHL